MNIIWSYFIVRYTTEDSFIIGVACDKKVGGSEARKPTSLKSGGLKPSSLIEVYAYGLDRQPATTFFRPSLYLNVTLYDCRDNNHLINFVLFVLDSVIYVSGL